MGVSGCWHGITNVTVTFTHVRILYMNVTDPLGCHVQYNDSGRIEWP